MKQYEEVEKLNQAKLIDQNLIENGDKGVLIKLLEIKTSNSRN